MLASVCALNAALLFLGALPIHGLVVAGCAVLFIAYSTWHGVLSRRAALVGAAHAADEQGDEARAQHLIEELARRGGATWVAATSLHRAQRALGQGDLETALVHLDAAVLGAKMRSAVELVARADRALVRALVGDFEGALDDIGATRAFLGTNVVVEIVSVRTLRAVAARAALAEVLVEASRGAGRAAIARHRVRIRRDTTARGLALLRSVSELVADGAWCGPYRAAPSAEPSLPAFAPLHAWVSRVLPAAATRLHPRERTALPDGTLEREWRSPPRSVKGDLVSWWVTLGLVLLGGFAPVLIMTRSPGAVWPVTLIAPACATLFAFMVAREFVDARRAAAAFARFAAADDASGREALAARSFLVTRYVADKFAALSARAFANGEFDRAIALADEGFDKAGACNPPDEARVVLARIRALALAARGRGVEARGEMRRLHGDAQSAVAVLHAELALVETFVALASGDIAQARAFAAATDESTLDGPASLVVELLLATEKERASLRGELQHPELVRFANAVAPALVAELFGEGHVDSAGGRGTSEIVDADADDAVESEAPAQRALRDG